MFRSIVVYASVFLLTLYCFFLYDDRIVGAMLAAEAVYLVAAFWSLSGRKKKLQITMEPLVPVAEKHQEIHLRVSVQNRSGALPVYVRAQVRMENTFTGETSRCILSGTVPAGGSTELRAVFQTGVCGNIRIALEKYWIYDVLHLIRRTCRGKEVQRIGVLPECHLLAVEVTRRTREFIADAEEYSDRESGDDPSEIYQVREYRETDSIHDIHWKLSAKADELLVKEHGRPLGAAVLIWLNLEEIKRQERKRANLIKRLRQSGKPEEIPAEMLELAASLSFSLLEERCVHMVAWYEPENHLVRRKKISKEEHIYELLNRLLFVKPCRDKEEMEGQYEEAFRGVTFSTVVELRMDGTVKTGEAEFHVPFQKAEWDQLYFTV